MSTGDTPSTALPNVPTSKWDLTPAVKIIEEFEGLFLNAYRDPVGVLTIGYGHTDGVKEGMKITKEQALQLLGQDIDIFAKGVDQLVTVIITNNERCALVSFSFNVGLGALKGSTLLRYLNSAVNVKEVAAEFAKWNHAGGAVLLGLTRRRAAEAALFLSPDGVQVSPT